MSIRRCRDGERDAILNLVNVAAAYRGVIPPDRWHEPYLPRRNSTRRSPPESHSGATRRTASSLVGPEQSAALLRRYWTIPDRQIETSVVLANSPLSEAVTVAPSG